MTNLYPTSYFNGEKLKPIQVEMVPFHAYGLVEST
jgi:hypothetical protein